jgi:hypothetical protein
MTIALTPEDRSKRPRPAVYLYRAAASYVHSFRLQQTAERSAKALFGDDAVTKILVSRSATAQAVTSSPGWAGALGQVAVEDSIAAITSTSAAAGLIQRGTKLNFDGRAELLVPGHLVDYTDAGGFVQEGHAVKVRNQRYGPGITLQPRKVMVIISFSREMAVSSNIETISRSLITEATSLILDRTLLGTQADDGTTPGGILQDATVLTPTAGGGTAALAGDVKALVGALVSIGAGRDPVFIANPQQAASIKLVASPLFDYPVLQSSALALGTLICVEASSFVSAFSAQPEFKADQHMAIIHMEDTSPTDITGGTPSPAVPVTSLWQKDSIALSMILRCSWGMRPAVKGDLIKTPVAIVNGATW